MFKRFKKWFKWIFLGGATLAVLGNVPIIPEDMKWVVSYETVAFDTADGDLGIDEYAIAGENEWFIREVSKDEGQFVSTTSAEAIRGKNEVRTTCEKCAYYDEFWDGEKVIRIFSERNKYNGLRYEKNYAQPTYTTKKGIFNAIESKAVSFTATTTSGIKTNVSSFSWSHTTASDDSLLIVTATSEDAGNPTHTEVTFNGTNLIQVASSSFNTADPNDSTLTSWYISSPEITTAVVAVTFNDTDDEAFAGATNYSGTITNISPIQATSTESGSNQNTDTIIIIPFGQNFYAQSSAYGGCDSTSVDGSQVQLWSTNSTDPHSTESYEGPLSTSVQHGYNGDCTSTTFGLVSVTIGDSAEPLSSGLKVPGSDCNGTAVASNAGDNNGFETPSGSNPRGVCDSNNGYLLDDGSGSNTLVDGCGTFPQSEDDQHDFHDFTFGVPDGATINGIEVLLEAKVAATTAGTDQICVELSWDGGTSFTSTGTTTDDLTTGDVLYTFGGPTITWGRTWSSTEVNDTNFRIRLMPDSSGSGILDYLTDYISARVYYTEAPAAATTGNPKVQIRSKTIIIPKVIIP